MKIYATMFPSTLLLAAHLACAVAVKRSPSVISTHLRGVASEPPFSKKEENKTGSNGTHGNLIRHQRGHFYFATKCEDCIYKGEQCGCEPAMEYFACLTKFCHAANHTSFADKCTSLSNKCYTDIDIKCHDETTHCKSKFHQLDEGGLGLTVDVQESDAFCGPFGKCIGHLKMKAKIFNAPKLASDADESKLPVFTAGAPTPSAEVAPSPAKAPAPASQPAPAPAALWLECGLPKVENADIDKEEDWDICQAEADGDEAECELSLPSEFLKAAEKEEVFCLLKDAENGTRLTHATWHYIVNVHDKAAAGEKVAEKKEEPEEAKGAKEEPKEAKGAKKKALLKDPMAAEAEKPKKGVESTLKARQDEGKEKVPWMDKKEKAAEAAKKEKANAKPVSTVAKEPVKNPSGLPWMAGKPAAPPIA